MRDYKARTGVGKTVIYYEPEAYCTPTPPAPSSFEYIKKESARSDIVQGNGIHPTSYWAFERTFSPGVYDYWRSSKQRCKSFGKPTIYYESHVSGDTQISPPLVQLEPGTKYPLIPSNFISRATNQLLSQVSSTKMNLSVVAGEMLSEAGQLTKLLQQIGRALLAIKRKKYKLPLKELGFVRGSKHKGLSNAYLAWHFGIKPLITTAVGLKSGIDNALDNPSNLLSARTVVQDNPPMPIIGLWRISGELTRGVQVGVKYKIDDPSLSSLRKLGLVNPLLTAWNLVSLSFVIDWFVSISGFLKGLSAPLGLTFHSGYYTEFVKTNLQFEDGYYAINPYPGYYTGKFPNFTITEKAMKRNPLFSWPSPQITYKFDLGAGQVTTLAALASSLLL